MSLNIVRYMPTHNLVQCQLSKKHSFSMVWLFHSYTSKLVLLYINVVLCVCWLSLHSVLQCLHFKQGSFVPTDVCFTYSIYASQLTIRASLSFTLIVSLYAYCVCSVLLLGSFVPIVCIHVLP